MPSDPKIIEFIQKRIRQVLADTSLVVKDSIGNGNFGIVKGNGFDYLTDEDSGHLIGLIPKKITESITVWFSVNIAINSSTNKLKDISIGVYSDEPKVKLFRAEWASNLSPIAHAQPHWHVHIERGQVINKAWDESVENDFLTDLEGVVNNKLIFNVTDIHFAMYASWHRIENKHVEDLSKFTDADIVNWTGGTLKYIIEQLIYLYNKKQLYN